MESTSRDETLQITIDPDTNLSHFRVLSEFKQEKKGGYVQAKVRFPNVQNLKRIEVTLVKQSSGDRNRFEQHPNILHISEFNRKRQKGSGQMSKDDNVVVLNVVDHGQNLKVAEENHKYLLRNGQAQILGDSAWNPEAGILELSHKGLLLTPVKPQTKKTDRDHIYADNADTCSFRIVWLKVTAHYADKSSIWNVSNEPVVDGNSIAIKKDKLYPSRFCSSGIQALVFHRTDISKASPELQFQFFDVTNGSYLPEEGIKFLKHVHRSGDLLVFVDFNLDHIPENQECKIRLEIFASIEGIRARKGRYFPVKKEILVYRHNTNSINCFCANSRDLVFDYKSELIPEDQVMDDLDSVPVQGLGAHAQAVVLNHEIGQHQVLVDEGLERVRVEENEQELDIAEFVREAMGAPSGLSAESERSSRFDFIPESKLKSECSKDNHKNKVLVLHEKGQEIKLEKCSADPELDQDDRGLFSFMSLEMAAFAVVAVLLGILMMK